MANDIFQAPRLERLPAVLARVGASKSTLYGWIAAGKFPAPVRISSNIAAWDARVVDRWILDRIADTEASYPSRVIHRTQPRRAGRIDTGEQAA